MRNVGRNLNIGIMKVDSLMLNVNHIEVMLTQNINLIVAVNSHIKME